MLVHGLHSFDASMLAHQTLSVDKPHCSSQSTTVDDGDVDFLSFLQEENACAEESKYVLSASPSESIRTEDLTASAVSALAAGADRGDTDTIATLVSLLSCPSWEIRVSAIEALVKVAKRGDRGVIGAITRCLKDDDPIVKYTAWEAVASMEENEGGWGDDDHH
mmetsp:Transcript_51787/g.82289  ORF Transcript_51787/g.82289 Transcript_51787/m.82289 type:complete len:164 (-) Transcript_51787:68-559(-)